MFYLRRFRTFKVRNFSYWSHQLVTSIQLVFYWHQLVFLSTPTPHQVLHFPHPPVSFSKRFQKRLLSKQSTVLDQERCSQMKHWKSSSEFLISFNKQQGPLLTIIHSKEEKYFTCHTSAWRHKAQSPQPYPSLHCHSKSCYIAVNPPEGASLVLTLEFLLDLHRAAAKADSDP